MCSYCGTIQLVDDRDRTVATLSLPSKDFGRAEKSLWLAVHRWDRFGAVGGYARDAAGKILAYG